MAQIQGNIKIAVRPVVQQDQPRLANLMHFEMYVHRHLDWVSPLELLDAHPFLTVEQDNQVQASLACPIDPPGVAWIRLFVASGAVSYEAMWQLLWAPARQELIKQGGARVVAIALQSWFANMLERNHFKRIQDVVFLTWEGHEKIQSLKPDRFTIRPMLKTDLQRVRQVDGEAFASIWQNSLSSLQAAFEQSHIATVAEDDQGIMGYQISTLGHLGGHLARLAVTPRSQGRKIGYALLNDLLHQFQDQNIHRVSVNTQQDNLVSLNLYQKFGFHLTGESYPVLMLNLSAH